MPKPPKNVMTARCSCGGVELEATGAPILGVVCHCADCHEGSRRIEALPNSSPVLDRYGGTPYLLYRKDRVKYLKGTESLQGFKVEADSPQRVFAACCNSAMLLDLDRPMHWVPIYRGRFQGEVPSLQMRINAKFKHDAIDAPRDLPIHSSFPLKFVVKLIAAKVAMIFHR
jgi:hypothetical protein